MSYLFCLYLHDPKAYVCTLFCVNLLFGNTGTQCFCAYLSLPQCFYSLREPFTPVHSGYCLGDAPTYTWFYDRLMFYHGKVYELGYITFGKPEHYLANMGLDYFLLITIFGFMFITVLLTYPFLQKAEVKDKQAAEKVAKKVN